jgi:hypothetical protein
VVFEQISFYFHFDHSDVRIKQDVSFRYRNELKIRPKKRIGLVHVDITNRNPFDLFNPDIFECVEAIFLV